MLYAAGLTLERVPNHMSNLSGRLTNLDELSHLKKSEQDSSITFTPLTVYLVS